MKEFNENPFLKNTPVLIFSSGTEADNWFHRNCDKCNKKGKCEIEKSILNTSDDFYCIIPLEIAKMIGINYDPLYQEGRVFNDCLYKKVGDEPF